MKTIKDFDVKNKRVLVRCDFNVPLDNQGNILDDFRIRATLPTIQYLVKKKAKIILMTHLGDPADKDDIHLKVDGIQKRLQELLKIPVGKADDCIGVETLKAVQKLGAGEILLLENLRFHKEEKENNVDFAKELSKLGEIYVNEAFSESHREYTSIVGVPQFLPHGAGLLLEKEVENLSRILQNQKHPMVALVGGAKIESKVKFINSISNIADRVLVSGLIKKELLAEHVALAHPQKVLGPENNLDALDISDETLELFCKEISLAKTVFWNGPFGKCEDETYKKGTLGIAKAIIKSKAFSVVGGGQTVEFLEKEGMIGKFDHISTGGGALLDFLSDQELPGLKALEN